MAQGGDGDRQPRPVVLLVEDQENIREAATRVLELDGYQVLSAGNRRSAMMLIATLDLPIDLVVTDLSMPELGGQTLTTELTRHLRTPRVLFISELSAAELSGLPGPVLTKPFTLGELRTRVREVMHEAGAPLPAAPDSIS
jgi:DNA-binding response OmpR family regulator